MDKKAKKQQKLEQVQEKLKEILTFLLDYLPFVNVSSNEFIIHNLWEKFLPDNIRQHAETMSEEEVLMLPERMKQYQMEFLKADKQQSKSVEKTTPWTFTSDYLESAPKVGKIRELHKIPVYPPNWQHASIELLLKDAAKNTLLCSGLVTSMEDMFLRLRSVNESAPLVIPNFMTSKKSHEVHIMSEVCSLLAKKFGVDVIVDMGSGKGYLSTQLVYQHNLCVVGVDAQTINTKGAQRRAIKLGRQWNALVQQAEEVKKVGKRLKNGKRYRKRMNRLNILDNSSKEAVSKSKQLVENQSEISEVILTDMQHMLTLDDDSIISTDWASQTSYFSDLDNIGDFGTKLNFKAPEEYNRNTLDRIDLKPLVIGADGDVPLTINYLVSQSEVTDIVTNEKHSENSEQDNTFQKVKHKETDVAAINDYQKEEGSELQCIDCTETQDPSGRKLSSDRMNWEGEKVNLKKSEMFFPVTTYVNDDMDILDLVKHIGASSSSGDTTLMLTGLHTCGSLGSSLQNLFVNSSQTKVLCYVGCCYHLMNEEFVMSPFIDGNENEKPGFPMSTLLRKHEVGLGRAARNFASQAVSSTQLQTKSYSRSLLQKILLDVIGYIDEKWKGLRKMDHKCKNEYEYVKRAFEIFKLPMDKITPDLVMEYSTKYKDEKRKLATFLQIKSLLAPCIEAVVLLDRYCHLLEQDCIEDVMLVQMFDPMTSPRCHAIIAFKQ